MSEFPTSDEQPFFTLTELGRYCGISRSGMSYHHRIGAIRASRLPNGPLPAGLMDGRAAVVAHVDPALRECTSSSMSVASPALDFRPGTSRSEVPLGASDHVQKIELRRC